MGKTISFAELDALSRDFGAWLQAQGPGQGRARRDHDAELPAVPGRHVRRAARRLHGGERQSALHRARARAPAARTRAPRRSSSWRTSPRCCSRCAARTPLKHVVVTSLGEMLGLKGLIVNLVVRKVKKMVPPYDLPGAITLQAGARPKARGKRARHAAARRTTTSPSCSTPAAPPACPRARCCCTATSSRRCCSTRRGSGPRSATSAPVIITALPLYHIFSLTVNCLVIMMVGGENMLITNPRDIPGFVKELAKHKFTMITRREHALQRAAQPSRISPSSTSRSLQAGARRRHGGAEGGRRALEAGHRHAADRGLRPHRDLAVGHGQPARPRSEYNGSIGLPMPSTEVELRDDNDRDVPLGAAGRDLHPRPAGDGGLLAAARRDRQGDRQGRLPAHRRHRHHGRRRASSASSTARRT